MIYFIFLYFLLIQASKKKRDDRYFSFVFFYQTDVEEIDPTDSKQFLKARPTPRNKYEQTRDNVEARREVGCR